MLPEIALLASLSSSNQPKLPRVLTPIAALLESCDREDQGDTDGAILVLQAAAYAYESTPSTTIPPVY